MSAADLLRIRDVTDVLTLLPPVEMKVEQVNEGRGRSTDREDRGIAMHICSVFAGCRRSSGWTKSSTVFGIGVGVVGWTGRRGTSSASKSSDLVPLTREVLKAPFAA